MVFYYHLLLFF
jgi:hypothetical protein